LLQPLCRWGASGIIPCNRVVPTVWVVSAKTAEVVYNWGKLAKTEPCIALALGQGSLYNHANPANMMYQADIETQTLNYFAARDIVDGEELSVNYNSGGQPEYENNTWFDNKGIDLIVD
jgi:hypothetical protein